MIGIIRPRTEEDRGGIAMMPMKKNVPQGRPEWNLVKCPKCGQECWDILQIQPLLQKQGVKSLCTECALRANINEMKG